MHERMTELETRIAFHEDALEQLSQIVNGQQRQLDELRQVVTGLAHRLAELRPSTSDAPVDETPPHY